MELNEALELVKSVNIDGRLQEIADATRKLSEQAERQEKTKRELSHIQSNLKQLRADLEEENERLEKLQEKLDRQQTDIENREKAYHDRERYLAKREIKMDLKYSEAKAMKREAKRLLDAAQNRN